MARSTDDLTPAQRLARALRLPWQLVLVTAGVLAFVASLKCFIEPNHLLSGGVTGTALLLQKLAHVPVGLGMALLNVPIFALGVRVLGRRFALLSGFAVLLTWVLADYTPLPPLTENPMLGGIFGGALIGVGSALALKSGGSLGGFDILGVVVNRRFSLGVGEVMLVLNGGLVVATGIIGSPELAMYTLIGIFATSWTLDALSAARPRKAFLIMTRNPERIRERILQEMGRGLTLFPARGGWAGAEMQALLCVVTQPEIRELSDIVRDEDATSFVVVLEASDVVGRFRTPSASSYWRKLRDAPVRG